MARWPAELRLSCEPSLQQESAGWVSASSVQPEAKASQEAVQFAEGLLAKVTGDLL